MHQALKRIMDIVIAIILTIIFSPIFIIIPILIWLESGPPVLYSHKRIGKDQKTFWLYKFRTMIKDADDVLYKQDKKLLKKFIKDDWKLENDPRITKLGRMLRNLTIDEFPQLYNVFRGEMSIVGPRAYIPREIKAQTERYQQTKTWMKTIFSVKPGITGPWQTSGRNIISFDKRTKMDLNYAKHNNILWDIFIILKT
ncbi:MAG: sugar transferase, partial [Candidatus Beckwithbacteria bacterium]